MRVLLVGHPVGHSLSPVMQNAAFRALGLPHEYVAEDVPAEGLARVLARLRDADYLGANVTVPYKLAVVPALDAVDADVEALGAANTIVSAHGRLSGHNTDVDGAWAGLLEPVRGSIEGRRVLLLGSGGGARAVMMALARCVEPGPDMVTVAARRVESAAELVRLGETLGVRCASGPWSDLAALATDARVLVNCTPVGLNGGDPLEGISIAGKVVLDLAYRPGGTPLFRRAWREAAMALQGDEMLLHQGAAAFELWTGRPAPVTVMRKALASALG